MLGRARCSGGWLPVGLVGVALVMPRVAAAAPERETGWDYLLNLSAAIGGVYQTNVYQNVSQVDDLSALGKLGFDLDLMPSAAWILEISYRGELELFNEQTTELHFSNGLGLVAGYRPLDRLYLSLHAGGDQTFYPDRREYSLWGVFGGLGARWEAGESSTLKLRYRFRSDQFPDYDLDNLNHTTELRYEVLLGEFVELALPLTWVARTYSERYLLDEAGDPTATLRSGHALELSPLVTYEPFFELRLDAGVTGTLNLTDDSYYYLGPFGVEDPEVDPELINHFDAFWAVAAGVKATWELHESVTAALSLAGGTRQYLARPAYDEEGIDRGEIQVDGWLQPTLVLEVRVATALRIKGSYGYLKQWSNDALWDFDDHRVYLEIGTGWEG